MEKCCRCTIAMLSGYRKNFAGHFHRSCYSEFVVALHLVAARKLYELSTPSRMCHIRAGIMNEDTTHGQG